MRDAILEELRASNEYSHGYEVHLIGIGQLVGVYDSEGNKLYEGAIIASVTHQEDITPQNEVGERAHVFPKAAITTHYTILPVDEDGNDAGKECQKVEAKYVREL